MRNLRFPHSFQWGLLSSSALERKTSQDRDLNVCLDRAQSYLVTGVGHSWKVVTASSRLVILPSFANPIFTFFHLKYSV